MTIESQASKFHSDAVQVNRHLPVNDAERCRHCHEVRPGGLTDSSVPGSLDEATVSGPAQRKNKKSHNKRMQGLPVRGTISPFNSFNGSRKEEAVVEQTLQLSGGGDRREVGLSDRSVPEVTLEGNINVRFLDTALTEQLESVWLLNDSTNKKERVRAVLESVAGLDPREASTVMMMAHTKGAGRIACLPKSAAQELVAKVSARVYVCACACACVRVRVCMCVRVCACACVHVFVCSCGGSCLCACVCVFV